MIFPVLTGNAHIEGPVSFPESNGGIYQAWAGGFEKLAGYDMTVLPFAVGDLDPNKGFVHVFDDTGLAVVMNELDTISGFVTYLRNREAYLRSGRLLMASGEEELLAHYLQATHEIGQRGFVIPDDAKCKIIIPEGEWSLLQEDSSWIARKKADQVSYFWDKLIEIFNKHILDGTSAFYPLTDFGTQELAVRALARETRFHRRLLSHTLGDFLQESQGNAIDARIIKPIQSGSPYYIFLTVRPDSNESYQSYRERRWWIGYAYLIEAKRKFTDAKEIVVIAMETQSWLKWTTEDVWYRGDGPVTADEMEAVRDFVKEQGVLTKLREPSKTIPLEYPITPDSSMQLITFRDAERKPHSARNSLCHCGSGRKFKKCCMGK